MTFRAPPGLLGQMYWYWNESDDAVGGLCSSWRQQAEVKLSEPPRHIRIGEHWYDRSLQLSGRVYVPKEQHHHALFEMNERQLAAERSAKPIREALQFAGPDVFEALRHRFREKLLVCRQHVPDHLVPFVDRWRAGCRIPFGLEGATGRRGNEFEGCLGVMLNPLRGCGGVAHLTQAARAAYARDRLRLRVRLDVAGWVDRLGGRICARGDALEATGPDQASDDELVLGRELRRQAEALVYGEDGALDRYSRVLQRRRRAG